MTGERADKVLVARGLARSRTEAQALIQTGQVTLDGIPVEKPSQSVPHDAPLLVAADARLPYVSRGGLKLQAALDQFQIPVTGRTALDVGASTGGFTDCLLQRGVARVIAIDVGHGQMDARLRADPRVDLREGVNARTLTTDDFGIKFDVIVADLSFISLTLILPVFPALMATGGAVLCLVKPQFEVGRERLGRGGIVRDARVRQEGLERVAAAARSAGLRERGRMDSPIPGGDGNQEFLLWLT